MICAGYRILSKSQTWLKTVVLAFSHQPRRALSLSCASHLSSVACLWGAGDAGQLGTGTQKLKSKPIKLEVESEVSHVGCGFGFTVVAEAHSCRLWTTGLNSSSQLGTHCRKKDLVLSPVLVDLHSDSPSTRIKQISCGRSHTAVLTDSGEVFVCGGNSQGQCGMGHFDLQYIEHFSKISDLGVNVRQVACGLDHTLLLTNDGKVFSCGWGADGQTGLGHFQNEASFKLLEGALTDVNIKKIATSADCCLALSDEGDVFSWGNNEYGQLAISDDQEQLAHPSRASSLETLPEIVDIAAGGSFCVVLTVTGELYSWGYGVLGHGPEVVFTKVPRRLQAFSDIDDRVGHVTCGPDMAAVVTDSGSLYTWGRGSFGRLGVGSDKDQWSPEKVELPGEVTEVSCGVDHMAVVLKDSYSYH